MFDLFDFAEFESVFPGSLTGQYEIICDGCGQVYEAEGQEGDGIDKVCPYCNTINS